jgi:amino acid transporter
MDIKDRSQLKRNVTLPMLVFYGLGNIFGAGIYTELSARYPLSAGVTIYINAGFNNPILTKIVGLTIAFSDSLSAATIIHGSHGYLSTFIQSPQIVTILILVVLLSTIAIWGISH